MSKIGDPILPLGAQVVEIEAYLGIMLSTSLGEDGGGFLIQGAAPFKGYRAFYFFFISS